MGVQCDSPVMTFLLYFSTVHCFLCPFVCFFLNLGQVRYCKVLTLTHTDHVRCIGEHITPSCNGTVGIFLHVSAVVSSVGYRLSALLSDILHPPFSPLCFASILQSYITCSIPLVSFSSTRAWPCTLACLPSVYCPAQLKGF